MENKEKTIITVSAIVSAPVETVWNKWVNPTDIVQWNNAADGWHTPTAENDLRVGGKFLYRMESKDGSMGFDFDGIYETVKTNELIEYTIGDGRKVKIDFASIGNETKIVETFEAENIHSIELQRGGWQAILDNFKKYIAANK